MEREEPTYGSEPRPSQPPEKERWKEEQKNF